MMILKLIGRTNRTKRVAERARKELWNYELMKLNRHHIYLSGAIRWFHRFGSPRGFQFRRNLCFARFVKVVHIVDLNISGTNQQALIHAWPQIAAHYILHRMSYALVGPNEPFNPSILSFQSYWSSRRSEDRQLSSHDSAVHVLHVGFRYLWITGDFWNFALRINNKQQKYAAYLQIICGPRDGLVSI